MKRLWYPTIALLTTAVAVVGFSMPDSRPLESIPVELEIADSSAARSDIMTTLSKISDLARLAEYLRITALYQLLSGEGTFTLFAPNNSVFAELNLSDGKEAARDSARLRQLLSRHIVRGRAIIFEQTGAMRVSGLAGEPLVIVTDGDEVKVGDAAVVEEGILCANGVIHVIDGVIGSGVGPQR
ncbi:MAG: fasciclin domain-containing protein [Candidatus Zixiibacteriota bacterium]